MSGLLGVRSALRLSLSVAAALGLLLLAGSGSAESSGAALASPGSDLQALAAHIDAALDALAAGDIQVAQSDYREFDEGWDEIEDGIRASSRALYRQIEDAMKGVDVALLPQAPDLDQASAALHLLRETIDAALPGLAP